MTDTFGLLLTEDLKLGNYSPSRPRFPAVGLGRKNDPAATAAATGTRPSLEGVRNIPTRAAVVVSLRSLVLTAALPSKSISFTGRYK